MVRERKVLNKLGRKPVVTLAKIKKYSEEGYGNVEYVAKKIGVTRGAVNIFMSKNPKTKAVLDADRDRLKDIAENKVANAILMGDMKVVKWYLARQARERGWGDKLEVEQKSMVHDVDRRLTEDEKKEIYKIMGIKK